MDLILLNQIFNIDRKTPFILACSGGVDSMAVADFFRRGGKSFEVAYFNHGTPQAGVMQSQVLDWAWDNQIVSLTGEITSTVRPSGLSPEEYWRNERYSFLHRVAEGRPIVTCHHLDDVCETWIFSSLHGNPKIISPVVKSPLGDLIWRPFLTNTKRDMIDWCTRRKVGWWEDTSNQDVSVPRNRIRHNIMKEALEINPGLHKVMKKKVLTLYEEIRTSTPQEE